MRLSQVTANYVTRVFGYRPPKPFNWAECDRATQDQFTSPGWQKQWAAICQETRRLGSSIWHVQGNLNAPNYAHTR